MQVDYLNITFPDSSMDDVRSSLLDLIFMAGAESINDELYQLGQGTVRLAEKRGFHFLSFSGVALSVLRLKSVYTDLLSIVSGVAHKVTRMDICHDTNEYTPLVLKRLYKRANSGDGVHLTRKKVRYNTKIISRSHYDSSDTGTVYLARRTSEVSCRVYDKRQERMSKGADDIGVPLTRYELTVSNKAGISLSDAHNPVGLFWRFMSDVLKPPLGYVDDWVPGGFSFTVPKFVPRLPAQLLVERVECSVDLGRMIGLADEIGSSGRQYLSRLLLHKLSEHSH